MAKFIIILFISLTTGLLSYLTYTGTGQEKIETLDTQSIRSNSSHSGRSGSSSYNASSYGYGK
ncbi:MAG: Unknown protein [uncultured Sulfurovum sp.]|uniref:Uncharacterized protein n=1 Tax=uncultured Sulfurovum sp. TaxID=269237 RepID=A0A6S6S774_9BACT|nr:MAG: Unknown protein [uncultured Sulfurovum sp.]